MSACTSLPVTNSNPEMTLSRLRALTELEHVLASAQLLKAALQDPASGAAFSVPHHAQVMSRAANNCLFFCGCLLGGGAKDPVEGSAPKTEARLPEFLRKTR